MFVRVKRKDTGLHFTVVDILAASDAAEQALDLILDLGIIQSEHLNSEQCWYVIAENLIACKLKEEEKRLVARDLANWLPPLSSQSLLETRANDIQQLEALFPDLSQEGTGLPGELNKKDPLIIIAGWLDGE